jgi:hypothetical protein
MSIRAGFGEGLPSVATPRPKIRATLDPAAGRGNGHDHSAHRAPPPEPIPERVLRFWNFDEAGRVATNPWRYMESDDERVIREQAERSGSWAGL